jgi:hypothetical protein
MSKNIIIDILRRAATIRGIFLLIVLLICILLVIYLIDNKNVKLEYQGEIIITTPSYLDKNDFYWETYDTSQKDSISQMYSEIESHISDRNHIKHGDIAFKYSGATLIDGDIYYVCTRCKIKSITYFRHSWGIQNDIRGYEPCSIVLQPTQQDVINVYKGDVNAARWGDDWFGLCGLKIEKGER